MRLQLDLIAILHRHIHTAEKPSQARPALVRPGQAKLAFSIQARSWLH